MTRHELESELRAVRRQIADTRPPRLVPVESISWSPGGNVGRVRLAAAAPAVAVGEVIEAVDRSGSRTLLRVLGIRGLYALTGPGSIAVERVQLPRRLRNMLHRERELVGQLTDAVELRRTRPVVRLTASATRSSSHRPADRAGAVGRRSS